MFSSLIFLSSFFQVFCLGLNSKLLRDDKIVASFFVSWFITASTFTQVWVVANSNLDKGFLFFFGGLGGSTGIVVAQILYKKYF